MKHSAFKGLLFKNLENFGHSNKIYNIKINIMA